MVRGGTLVTPEGLRAASQNAGKVFDKYGHYGLCVAFGSPMSVVQAVMSRPLRNPQLSLSTPEVLEGEGFPVTPEPDAERPFAGILWLPDREPETFNRLAVLFDVVDSPLTREERRDL